MYQFLLLERRGIPQTGTQYQFHNFLDKLSAYIISISSDSATFASTCMTASRIETFETTSITGSKFTARIEGTSQSRRQSMDYFYLSTSSYSRARMAMTSNSFTYNLSSYWHEIQGSFSGALRLFSAEKASRLKNTIDVLFDPNEQVLRLEHTKNYSTAASMSGDAFLYECLAVVYTMELLDISRVRSMNIFEHCAAFLFQSIRMERQEAEDVLVSPFFVAMYWGALGNYTGGMKEGAVEGMMVSGGMVEKAVGMRLDAYMLFDAWGRKDYMDWESEKLVIGEDVIFGKTIMDSIKAQVNAVAQKAPLLSATISATKRVQQLKNAVRSASTCGSSAYTWYPRELASGGENCCATLCDNTVAIVRVGVMSKATCCGLCNRFRCDYSSGPLATLDVMHVVPYGYMILGPLYIMI